MNVFKCICNLCGHCDPYYLWFGLTLNIKISYRLLYIIVSLLVLLVIATAQTHFVSGTLVPQRLKYCCDPWGGGSTSKSKEQSLTLQYNTTSFTKELPLFFSKLHGHKDKQKYWCFLCCSVLFELSILHIGAMFLPYIIRYACSWFKQFYLKWARVMLFEFNRLFITHTITSPFLCLSYTSPD